MKPAETGRLYDSIASWWNDQQCQSLAGIHFIDRAIKLCVNKRNALDAGCGSGGRMIAALEKAGFQVTGIDVSQAMIAYARTRHPDSHFMHVDVCTWQPQQQYDAIIAWDSLFHLPYAEQGRVIKKLCNAISGGGVILFTAGGINGEITGQMCGKEFYYSSLAEEEYLRIMQENGCRCILMERDQYPEEHVVFIGQKTNLRDPERG